MPHYSTSYRPLDEGKRIKTEKAGAIGDTLIQYQSYYPYADPITDAGERPKPEPKVAIL
jgi:hypothetical protein